MTLERVVDEAGEVSELSIVVGGEGCVVNIDGQDAMIFAEPLG
jgi:hypothetical protein